MRLARRRYEKYQCEMKMHGAWNKENGWCYYRCGFTFFSPVFLHTKSTFLKLSQPESFFWVGSARPVKFHQVSLSQSTIQLRKTSVMKISHSSSYLSTRTSMFTPSRRSYNQRWVLICPEGSSAWIELLSWVRVSLTGGGNFRNHEGAEGAAGGAGLPWAAVLRRHEKVP